MKKAKIPINDIDRLKELESYSILDTKNETEFDDLTYMASKICQTPIALVSLIDKDRQWFKSKIGLNANQTDRDISFCGHAINQEDLFEVNNSLNDERFKDNPLVIGEPKVIFYAGMPLCNENGFKLGTLCVIDHKEKKLNDFQKQSLEILGKQVVAQMELKRKNLALEEKLKETRFAQADLISQAKNYSVGKLSDGISHEINNPLSILKMSVKNLRRSKYLLEDDQKFVNIIDKNLDRITNIVKSLQVISNYNEKKIEKNFYLIDIFNHIEVLLNGYLEKNNINLEISQNLKDIEMKGDFSYLVQAFYNILENSIEAISNLGKNKWIKVSAFIEGSYVNISITDSGKLDSIRNISDKIFDPFFSTKKEHHGLGLTLSNSILEKCDAKLFLNLNNPHTNFIIQFKKEII